MKNILVGLDFHDNTDQLIDKAVSMAKAFGAKIWLYHIANQQPDFLGYDGGSQYLRDHRAQELKEEHKTIGNWASIIEEEGLEAEGLLITGQPVTTILDKAKELNIDLIICGHHEHSKVYELFIGSRSAKLIRKSKIPVMVIPFEEDLF